MTNHRGVCPNLYWNHPCAQCSAHYFLLQTTLSCYFILLIVFLSFFIVFIYTFITLHTSTYFTFNCITSLKFTMVTNHLRCMYWNIHGISSKILGDKTKDPEYLRIISEWDILALSELHTDRPISIPRFCVKKN